MYSSIPGELFPNRASDQYPGVDVLVFGTDFLRREITDPKKREKVRVYCPTLSCTCIPHVAGMPHAQHENGVRILPELRANPI